MGNECTIRNGGRNSMYREKLMFLDWKRRTKVIYVLIILAMVLLTGSVLKVATARTEAHTTSGSSDVHATGLLQATVYNLNFQNTGVAISEIDVAQGQTVASGEVLARQDASM